MYCIYFVANTCLTAVAYDETSLSLFCQYFKTQAVSNGDIAARYFCAYHFPALMQCIGAKRFTLYIQATFKTLCEDKDSRVRKTMACGFHEVAKIFGQDQAAVHLKDQFIKLLKDDIKEVQDALVSHLPQTFDSFKSGNRALTVLLIHSLTICSGANIFTNCIINCLS